MITFPENLYLCFYLAFEEIIVGSTYCNTKVVLYHICTSRLENKKMNAWKSLVTFMHSVTIMMR